MRMVCISSRINGMGGGVGLRINGMGGGAMLMVTLW